MGNKMNLQIALAALALALTACQGQNAFKRESNPTKGYESVLSDARAYSPEQQRAKEAHDQQLQMLPCGIPFVTTVDEGDKGLTAVFTEGTQKSVTIKVDRIAGQLAEGRAWDVTPVDSPCTTADCFKPVSVTADSRVYKFTWTAPKGSAGNDVTNKLVLRFKWDIEARCSATTPITQTIALVVVKGDNDPVLSFRETKDVKFGSEPLKFQLVLQGATSAGKLSFVDKNDGLSTAAFTECGEPKADAKGLVYNCTFSVGALKPDEIKDLIGKGVVKEVSLNAHVEGKKPLDASVKLRVTFEKVETPAKTADAATPEAAPAKVPAKKGAKK